MIGTFLLSCTCFSPFMFKNTVNLIICLFRLFKVNFDRLLPLLSKTHGLHCRSKTKYALRDFIQLQMCRRRTWRTKNTNPNDNEWRNKMKSLILRKVYFFISVDLGSPISVAETSSMDLILLFLRSKRQINLCQ